MAEYGAGMRVITAFFGPYAPEALIAHVSVFSHDFNWLERLPKLATSYLAMVRRYAATQLDLTRYKV